MEKLEWDAPFYGQSKVREAIKKVLEEVITVIPRPDNGSGEDWWVGVDLIGHPGDSGFWDPSCTQEWIAHKVARDCRRGLEERILAALAAPEGVENAKG